MQVQTPAETVSPSSKTQDGAQQPTHAIILILSVRTLLTVKLENVCAKVQAFGMNLINLVLIFLLVVIFMTIKETVLLIN